MLILCFPHESASAQSLLAHSSSNQRKIWLFRKWWNFHISDFSRNLSLPLNHTSGYPSQYPTHWFTMVTLRMGLNIEMQKHPQRSKAPLRAIYTWAIMPMIMPKIILNHLPRKTGNSAKLRSLFNTRTNQICLLCSPANEREGHAFHMLFAVYLSRWLRIIFDYFWYYCWQYCSSV